MPVAEGFFPQWLFPSVVSLVSTSCVRSRLCFPPGPGLEAGALSLLVQAPGSWWDVGASWCCAAAGVSAPCGAYLGEAHGSLATALQSSSYLVPREGLICCRQVSVWARSY